MQAAAIYGRLLACLTVISMISAFHHGPCAFTKQHMGGPFLSKFIGSSNYVGNQWSGNSAYLSAPRSSNLRVTMFPDTGSNVSPEDSGSEEQVDFILGNEDLNDVSNSIDQDSNEPAETLYPAAVQHAEDLKQIRAKYARTENDTGSPEFQVAGMTERILYLTKHLQQNPKDFSTRRGLVALVNKRRRLLNYLFTEDVSRYTDVVKSLGIRHRAPGRVMTRDEKYAKFASKKKR